ncbi:MAG: DUF4321 domain-containing protein [Clostridium sp.]|nr:DUF4321 domain-containing protein [Clostridium sp.]MCM1547990.1 DUF4321 domain-containing protein [Ruminococcus sp.]
MKNKILLIMMILAGAIVGSIVANAAAGSDMLGWLSYSKSIGFTPTDISLIIFKLTIGFEFSMSVAQIIFMLIAIAVYPKLAKAIA